MAKIKFSPIVTEVSGSVGDATFAKWKGHAYLRSKVTPSNPNSAAQQAVRNSMSAVVSVWQSFATIAKTAWGVFASGLGYSGYNAFTKANRALEQADSLLTITPAHADVEGAATFTAVTGSASGEIDLSWTGGTESAAHKAYIVARKDGADALTVEDEDTTLMSADSYTITGLTADTEYQVYLINKVDTTNLMSVSKGDTATSKA